MTAIAGREVGYVLKLSIRLDNWETLSGIPGGIYVPGAVGMMLIFDSLDALASFANEHCGVGNWDPKTMIGYVAIGETIGGSDG